MDLYFGSVPLLGDACGAFLGQWSERKWLNVPGPSYGADADNCGTGRMHAPGLVLYEAGYCTEYVYRQPRTAEELQRLVDPAEAEASSACGCDGDTHWTPPEVREWWRDRGRIREHLANRRADWEADDANAGQGVAAAALNYAAYPDGELAAHLREAGGLHLVVPGVSSTRSSEARTTPHFRNTSPPSILVMTKPEKRRDLERALLAAGCSIKSTSGGHDKWICGCDKHSANIPRHGTISPGVVANTIKRLACLPKGWL